MSRSDIHAPGFTLRRLAPFATAWAAVVTLSLGLTACSSTETSIVGNWVDAQGKTATVLEDGQCTGMYYSNGAQLDIGGGMTCSYSDGSLVVTQPPNQISYGVELETDTMTLTSGSQTITMNRLGSKDPNSSSGRSTGSSADPTPQSEINEIIVSVTQADSTPASVALLSTSQTLIEHRLDRAGVKYTSVTENADGNVAVLLPTSASVAAVQKATGIISALAGSGFHRVIAVADAATGNGAAGSSPRLTQAVYDEFLTTTCTETMMGPVAVADGLEVVCDSDLVLRYLIGDLEFQGMNVATVDETGSTVTVNLNAEGTQSLSTLSQDLLGRQIPDNQLAFVSGSEVVSAPTINAAIANGVMEISGTGLDASLLRAELEFASQGGALVVQNVSGR